MDQERVVINNLEKEKNRFEFEFKNFKVSLAASYLNVCSQVSDGHEDSTRLKVKMNKNYNVIRINTKTNINQEKYF